MNHMFMFQQDAKTYMVSALMSMREALNARFSKAEPSAVSFAAKLLVWTMMDSAVGPCLRRLFRDSLMNATVAPDDLDPKQYVVVTKQVGPDGVEVQKSTVFNRRYFLQTAKQNVRTRYLSQGKDWEEDEDFEVNVEKERIKLMAANPTISRIAMPVRLRGKTGTVFVLKSEGYERTVRNLRAMSMALRFLDIEEGPDSVGLFEVDTRGVAQFTEDFSMLESEGNFGEKPAGKLFVRHKTFVERVGALINAPGGSWSRNLSAELQRESGFKSFKDKEVEYTDNIVHGEQVQGIYDLKEQVVINTIRWKLTNGFLDFLARQFLKEHQAFSEALGPQLVGKTGFKAGRKFYAHGFGVSRLAVKGKDSFLLFTTQAESKEYDKLKASIWKHGIKLPEGEFKRILRDRNEIHRKKEIAEGREIWLRGYDKVTLAMKFAGHTDTARLIQRLANKVVVPQTADDRVREFLEARTVQPPKLTKWTSLWNAYLTPKG